MYTSQTHKDLQGLRIHSIGCPPKLIVEDWMKTTIKKTKNQ